MTTYTFKLYKGVNNAIERTLQLRGFIVEKLLRPIAVILEIIQSSLEDGAVSFSE